MTTLGYLLTELVSIKRAAVTRNLRVRSPVFTWQLSELDLDVAACAVTRNCASRHHQSSVSSLNWKVRG